MKKYLQLSVAIAISSAAFCQTSYQLDNTFTAGSRTNGSIIVQTSGKILLGSKDNGSGPVRLNSDGTLDGTFSSSINSTAILFDHPDGSIYCFGYRGTTLAQNGTENADFYDKITAFGTGGNLYGGYVIDADITSTGTMILVGKFNYVSHNNGGFNSYGIVKLGAQNTVDHNFRLANGTGFNDDVTCVEIDEANGKIYCGGKFTSFNGNAVSGLCRLNMDGSFDNTFNPGSGFPINNLQIPNKLLLLSDGNLLALGGFQSYDGNVINSGIVKIDPTGERITSFQPMNIVYGRDALEMENGEILVTGINYIYAINSTTGATNFQNGFSNNFYTPGFVDGGVYQIEKVEDGKYIYGGTFLNTHGQAYDGLAEMYICDQAEPTINVTFSNGVLSTDYLGGTYEWVGYDGNENSLTLSNNTSTSFTPTEPGWYVLNINDAPCVWSSDWIDLSTLSVDETSNTMFTIYPNPTKEEITINGLNGNSIICVFDNSARSLKTIDTFNSSLKIDLTEFANGVYYLKITNEKGITSTQKLVIE